MSEIDPTLFDPSRDLELGLALTTVAADYSASLATLEAHTRQNDPEHHAGLQRELRELPDYKKLEELIGEGFMANLGFDAQLVRASIQHEEGAVSDEECDQALLTVRNSELGLSCFVTDFAHSTFEKARGFFDTDSEAHAIAWSSAWQKLHDIISTGQSTSLVDIANLFDGLVRLQYADTYDPQSPTRGLEQSNDPAAIAFYQVFSKQLSRAITRRTEDGWTGQ